MAFPFLMLNIAYPQEVSKNFYISFLQLMSKVSYQLYPAAGVPLELKKRKVVKKWNIL